MVQGILFHAFRPKLEIGGIFDKIEISGIPVKPRNKYDFQVRNGMHDFSPQMGSKRCGNNVPEIPETTGNNIYIKFKSSATNQAKVS